MHRASRIKYLGVVIPLFVIFFLLLGLHVPAQAAEAPPAPIKKSGAPPKIQIKEFFRHDKTIPVVPLPKEAKRDVLLYVAKRVWPHPDKKMLPYIKRAIATMWKDPLKVDAGPAKARQIAGK